MVKKDVTIPEHVAIVMDGNRRWAKKKGLPVIAGHAYVVNTLTERLIERAVKRGVSYITFWAWSTENWKRGKIEVTGIMQLFRMALEKKVAKLIKQGARVRVIGDTSQFPEDIQNGLAKMVEDSKDNTRITVTWALNYGGRDEVARAMRKILGLVDNCQLPIANLSTQIISEQLDTAGMPDPDLIIRPGGEKRLSGFLLWQSEYAELYFSDVLMPDFDETELDKAVDEYELRQRRFGK